MSFKLVDTVRGKVLQEFETKEQAERALQHQSVLDNNVVELQASAPPAPKKVAKKVKADAK
jgi:hypothetical protein